MKRRTLTVLTWNSQGNGNGGRAARIAGHELLARHTPDLIFRQGTGGADADGGTIRYELEDVLALRGWLGPGSHTALFASTHTFAPVRQWATTGGNAWLTPPTALTLRLRRAGDASLPILASSYHLDDTSAANRLAETGWLTALAGKQWTTPDGRNVGLPALLGGDSSSYPADDLPDAPALPDLEAIPDPQHRAHRSRPDPAGGRRPDTAPDAALRRAGLVDTARHWAAGHGDPTAVARTVNASPATGPDSRTDRIYTTGQLLPAIAGADVIEVPEATSGHHILRLTLDADTLADLLAELARPTA
ncbi:endonuclease/exonuclease/phosphatase family protein [Actinacidiphila sp. ITFR-21]|uniref:endonuclease/exonuclease/phosphatase family protein n=1 Tax=Actinacidiphila sp. ITFR-21 TaxID=3075199 RepID=UPI00288A9FE6|nr:endonuclease/exonuclease/phosphatase family protein [Streptomyces sp. ITFR-21]WNI19970.1 endonuclease/exonuclease/phosphatase family protein [Streptomyces sp. ITFR-21]